MIKNILLALSLGALVALGASSASAGEFRLGANGGYTYSGNPSTKQDLYGLSAYGQYVFDGGLGLEGGYTYFGDGKIADRKVKTQGPYVAASLNANLGQNFAIFTRAGALYSISDVSGESTENRVAPFLGLGAQFNFSDSFYVRGGYDHYFKTTSNKYFDQDLDMLYAGLGFKF